MKVLLMKKDGIIHKVSELNRTKVQDKLDAGFVIVGSEDLDAPDEVADAVAKAIKALNVDAKIAKAVEKAVADAVNKAVDKAVEKAVADAVNKAVEKAITDGVKKFKIAEATQEPKK
jgi:hypothetical protein